MRHRKAGVKLNMTSSHKQAMFRNMVTSLFKHDRIRTTDAKAKELRRWADHMITLAKRGDLHARRQAMAVIREKDVVHKLFEEVADRFGSLAGGYTRVIKLGRRPGDAAPVSLIELVTPEGRDKKKKTTKKAKTAAPKKIQEKVEEKPAEKEASEAVEEQPQTGDVDAGGAAEAAGDAGGAEPTEKATEKEAVTEESNDATGEEKTASAPVDEALAEEAAAEKKDVQDTENKKE